MKNVLLTDANSYIAQALVRRPPLTTSIARRPLMRHDGDVDTLIERALES